MDLFIDGESNSINMTAFNLTFSSFEQQLLLSLAPNCFRELVMWQDNATQECIQEFLSSANMSLNMINETETSRSENISSETTTVDGDRPFIPMFWIQLAWSLVFGLMVIVAVVGNVIVIYIVLAHRRMRTVTNFFLLNLTIADLVTATFNAIFNFVFMLNSHWPFGQSYCVINNFIANLTIVSSVFTITATSIDR
jgi:7 transmembrane receptor (rhodopsin family)